MKRLKEFKDLICCDLVLVTPNIVIYDVWKDGAVFAKYENYPVIGLRAVNEFKGHIGPYLVISLGVGGRE